MNEDSGLLRIYNREGECLLSQLEIADTFRTRLRGLLGRTHIGKDYGLLLLPCASIHMFFMKFAIDVFFLKVSDGGYAVLRVARNVKPWRMALAPRGTDAVLETAPGALPPLSPGHIFKIQ